MNLGHLGTTLDSLRKRGALGLLAAAACFPVAAFGQSQTQSSPPPAQQQQQSQPAQTASQAPAQSQTSAAPATDSVAEAARKAKAKNAAAKSVAGKTYTEEDLAGLPSRGVSVVGDGAASRPSDDYNSSQQQQNSQEAYWRGRARAIHQQMESTDAQIKQTEEDIKKYGNGGFDPSTGLRQNVIYFEDRQAKLNSLKKRRADLEKQLDDLQDEARKASVLPDWVR